MLCSMSQDQSFIWKSSLVGPENWVEQSLWDLHSRSKSVRSIESQIWCQPAISLGRRFRKGAMAFAYRDFRHFIFSLFTFCAFQAATPVLELRENESD